MVSDAGRLVDDELSQYDAKGTPFLEGDVLFGKLRPYLAKYWLADRSGTAGGDIHVYRPAPDVEPRFLRYLVGSRDFIKYAEAASKGVKMPRVEWIRLREFGVSRPARWEQQRIADYLDSEIGEIDAMIAKMDELANNLRSRLRAETHSVLAPAFTKVTQPIWSALLPIKDQNHPGEEVLSVYRDYGVIPKSSRGDNHNRTPQDLTSYQLVEPGDVVINKMKAWQGSLGASAYRGIVSPDYQVARPTREMNSQFLHAVLRSQLMVPQYRARSIGVRPSQWRLYWNEFADLHIPLPPLDEQQRIANHLDDVTSRIEAMLAKVAELRSLLTERRAALITDVVTGRKEVA